MKNKVYMWVSLLFVFFLVLFLGLSIYVKKELQSPDLSDAQVIRSEPGFQIKLKYDIQKDEYDIVLPSGVTYADVDADIVHFRPHTTFNPNLIDEWNRDGHSVSLNYYYSVVYVNPDNDEVLKVIVYIYFG